MYVVAQRGGSWPFSPVRLGARSRLLLGDERTSRGHPSDGRG